MQQYAVSAGAANIWPMLVVGFCTQQYLRQSCTYLCCAGCWSGSGGAHSADTGWLDTGQASGRFRNGRGAHSDLLRWTEIGIEHTTLLFETPGHTSNLEQCTVSGCWLASCVFYTHHIYVAKIGWCSCIALQSFALKLTLDIIFTM